MTGRRLLTRKLIIPFIALVGLGLIYPFETTVVPAWKIRVIDNHGAPYPGLKATEVWRHYSLTLSAGDNEEDRWTDNEGYVEFPKRTIRMSAVKRLGFTILTAINSLMHGSTGVHAYVLATGPQGITYVKYDPQKSPPDRFILPREKNE